MTKSQEFWAWINQCPDGVYAYRDSTDDEDEQKIHVFGFVVPKEEDDDDND
jgi:hypothetical protein